MGEKLSILADPQQEMDLPTSTVAGLERWAASDAFGSSLNPRTGAGSVSWALLDAGKNKGATSPIEQFGHSTVDPHALSAGLRNIVETVGGPFGDKIREIYKDKRPFTEDLVTFMSAEEASQHTGDRPAKYSGTDAIIAGMFVTSGLNMAAYHARKNWLMQPSQVFGEESQARIAEHLRTVPGLSINPEELPAQVAAVGAELLADMRGEFYPNQEMAA